MTKPNRTNGYKTIFKLIGRGQLHCGICKESLTDEIHQYLEFFARKYLKRKHCERCTSVYRGDRKHININIDHTVPLGSGGQDVLKNLQLVHRTCNDLKGSSDPTKTDKQTFWTHEEGKQILTMKPQWDFDEAPTTPDKQ